MARQISELLLQRSDIMFLNECVSDKTRTPAHSLTHSFTQSRVRSVCPNDVLSEVDVAGLLLQLQ